MNPDTGLAGGALTGAKSLPQDRNIRPLLDQHLFQGSAEEKIDQRRSKAHSHSLSIKLQEVVQYNTQLAYNAPGARLNMTIPLIEDPDHQQLQRDGHWCVYSPPLIALPNQGFPEQTLFHNACL